MTMEKLYDLSGSTHQKIGVTPHIPIPDLWSSLSKGENEYSNALSNDVIDKKIKVDALPDSKISICADLSANRIKTDYQFRRTISLADTLRKLYSGNSVPLYPMAYYNEGKTMTDVDSIIDSTFSEKYNPLTIKPTKSNDEIMQMDEFLKSLIAAKIEDLKKDIILREAYNIIIDYNSN